VYPCRFVYVVLAGLVLIAGAIAGEPAQGSQSKPQYLLNFAEFTDWPPSAFTNDNEPLAIGILGKDPFQSALDKVAENQVVRGRHVRILRFRKVEEMKLCHILYISESEQRRLARIISAVSDKPLLTVSEIKNSAERGVVIEMKPENQKIRLLINLEAAKASHLNLKSQLLRLGEIVEPLKK
jgi:YfiR/HmsC-like